MKMEDQCDASANQRKPKIARKKKKGVRMRQERIPLRFQRELGSASTLILDFWLQDSETIKFCCLSQPVYGALLWQI